MGTVPILLKYTLNEEKELVLSDNNAVGNFFYLSTPKQGIVYHIPPLYAA